MIKLTLTDEQAEIVSKACEFFARIKVGQFSEITWNMLARGSDDYLYKRNNAEKYLLEARKFIYPELHDAGHSYGIGKFKDADMSFDVYQVIRYAMGDDRKPFSYRELPKCEQCD